MANITLIPSVLMILFSCLLIGSIFKARGRVRLNNSEREKKRLKQDIKFINNKFINNEFIAYFINFTYFEN